jgi:hypothetical protein
MSRLAFTDPVFESQAAFRAILAAMARPGAIHPCGQGLEPPAPLSPAAAAAILALADVETPLWIAPSFSANDEISAYLKFHTGAPLAAAPNKAVFALTDAASDALRLADFAQGAPDYPDRSRASKSPSRCTCTSGRGCRSSRAPLSPSNGASASCSPGLRAPASPRSSKWPMAITGRTAAESCSPTAADFSTLRRRARARLSTQGAGSWAM